MKGRWTIHFRHSCRAVEGDGFGGIAEVPVVPCDDAAIERVADMLAYNDSCGHGPVSRAEYLADAAAVLRAAGETP